MSSGDLFQDGEVPTLEKSFNPFLGFWRSPRRRRKKREIRTFNPFLGFWQEYVDGTGKLCVNFPFQSLSRVLENFFCRNWCEMSLAPFNPFLGFWLDITQPQLPNWMFTFQSLSRVLVVLMLHDVYYLIAFNPFLGFWSSV